MKKYILILALSIVSFGETNSSLEALLNAIRIFNNKYAAAYIVGYKPKTIKKNNKNFDVEVSNNNSVEKTIEKIDINQSNDYGYTPLIVAAQENNEDILKLLLENNANLDVKHPILGKPILNTAIYYGSYNVVKVLLELHPELVNKQDPVDGWTPIMMAVLRNNKDILNLLLSYNADATIKDKSGSDAIDLAIKYGKGELIKIIRDDMMKKE